MRDQYIQLCCDFYNEHTPKDKLWFGRMYDQCQEEYEKQNRCMFRWQFPLMVLKSEQAKINELKKHIEKQNDVIEAQKACRDELQNRIDSAVEKLKWQNWKQWDVVRDKTIKVLRGEQ